MLLTLKNILKKLYEKQTFRDILDKELFWDGYHPSESAHLKWARILYKDLKDKL